MTQAKSFLKEIDFTKQELEELIDLSIKFKQLKKERIPHKYLDSLKEKSMYNTDIDVNSNDTILTLSTCDYSVDDGRFVVQAKLVK